MALSDQLDAKQLFEKLERLPGPYRLGILAGVFVAIVAIYWLAFYGGKRQELKGIQGRLATLETKINESRAVASNLKSFKEKQEQLEAELRMALRRLPNSKELPVLLTDITSVGKKSGLEFRSFKPGQETRRGFYAQVPIQIEIRGRYHDVGTFFDRLARLDRIVNVEDFSMEVAGQKEGDPRLKVSGTAMTFRFVDDAAGSAEGE